MQCELCGEIIEFYYEHNGKVVCMGCYDDPDRKYKISNKSDFNSFKADKKEKNICIKCDRKSGKSKLDFFDEYGDEIILCYKCYNDISKEEKLKLIVNSGKPFEINPGYMFGFIGGASYKNSQKKGIDKVWKQYDLSLDEINKYAIMKFNKHFLICTNELRGSILAQMHKEFKLEKLDQISIKKFNKNYYELDGKEKRIVKKNFKNMLKNNYEKNKDRGTLFG